MIVNNLIMLRFINTIFYKKAIFLNLNTLYIHKGNYKGIKMNNKYEFITVNEYIENVYKANDYEIISAISYIENLENELHPNKFAV